LLLAGLLDALRCSSGLLLLLLLQFGLLGRQLQGEMTGGERGVQGKALEDSPILLEATGTPL
jgi:hypothetical protein